VTAEETRIQLRFDGGRVVSATPVGVHDHAALGELLVRCGLLTRESLEAVETERLGSGEPLPRILFQQRLLSVPEIEEIEGLLTRETIFQLLRWQRGSFHFSAQPVEHEREPGTLLGAEQILMDGLRMIDEYRSFAGVVAGGESVFQRVAPFERWREAAVDAPSRRIAATERVYLLVDGRLPVRRVIDLSRLGTFEATRLLADLTRSGVIARISSEQLERTRRRRRIVAPPPSTVERLAAQGLPYALACLLLAAAFWNAGPTPHERAAAWREPVLEARTGYALRRVRNAVDAHRYALGKWPARLPELAAKGFLPPDALTPEQGATYYYARDAQGAAVLAPER
jgi:hypothetical protein